MTMTKLMVDIEKNIRWHHKRKNDYAVAVLEGLLDDMYRVKNKSETLQQVLDRITDLLVEMNDSKDSNLKEYIENIKNEIKQEIKDNE